MGQSQLQVVVRHAQRVAGVGEQGLGDGKLLRRFLNAGEGAAFGELVRRHGPMVLGVCRRILQDGHAAEDAFQATFLVLLRRARALGGQRGSLAGWLYTVASHVALKARADAARRRAKEGQVVDMPRADAQAEQVWPDLQPVLDEELNRLPETYRAALVLCYLQGKTNEEAGRLLGWPVGTVKSRLARARELLRGRLARRGVSVTPALLSATLTARASAALPAALVDLTVGAALALAARGFTAASALSGPVALAEGVLKGMLAARLALATVVLSAVLAGAMTAVGLAQAPQGPPADKIKDLKADAPQPGMAGPKARPQAPAPPRTPALPPLPLSGRVLGPDGKPVAEADVVAMTCPWRYIHHGAPRFGAGYEVLARGKAGKDGSFRLSLPRDRWAFPVQIAYPIQLVASAPGHGPGWRPVMANRAEKDEQDGLEVRLPREEVLRGRLIDLQGKAAAGVKLSAVRVGKKGAEQPTGKGGWEFMDRWDGLEEYTARVGEGIQKGLTIPDFRPTTGLQFWAPPGKLPFWPEPVVTDAEGRFRLRGVGSGQDVALLVQDDRFGSQVLEFTADPKGQEVTRVTGPARWLEGVVVAADTGKPLAGALVHVDTRAGTVLLAFGHTADWKGRHFVRRGWGVFDYSALFMPPVRTDAQGRFRVNTFWGESSGARMGSVTITVAAPDGQPYLTIERGDITWPRGAVRREMRLELPRGVLVRGRVTEKASGQPVARASVDFWSKGLKLPPQAVHPGPVTAAADGTFHLVVPAGKAHLLVNAPRLVNGYDPEFAAQKIPVATLTDRPEQVNNAQGAPLPPPDREPHCYPCAWRALDLRPGAEAVDLAIPLERKGGR
jgi:RNA polymerase sigma factor (sigma-70 family)